MISSVGQSPSIDEPIPFIFIGGCGRSGTTLVQKLLSSHSQVVGGPEFDHGPRLFDLYRTMASPEYLERQAAFYDRDGLTRRFRAFYESFFRESFLRKPGALFFSEKTPANIAIAPTLLELFPESRFISVIRDGRDVVLSFLEVRRKLLERDGRLNARAWSLPAICRQWNLAIEGHFDLINRTDLADRQFVVRFERIVAEPEPELRRLLGFLRLDFEDRLLRPEQITERETGDRIDDVWYSQAMYRQGFNPAKIGRWRREMNPRQRLVVNLLLARNLNRLGYALPAVYLPAHRGLRLVNRWARGLAA